MKFIALVILSITILSAKAQNILTPGSYSFEHKFIEEKAYRMKWVAIKDTMQIELGELLTKYIADNNYLTIVTEVIQNKGTEPWIDSTVAEVHTLAPVYHSSYNWQRDIQINFGRVLTGFYWDKVKKENHLIKDSTKFTYFDSNLYPSLIAWLPLNEGYKQDISIYDFNLYGKQGVMMARIKEVKSGIYESFLSGIQPVWIVVTTDEISNDIANTKIYYVGKSDRKLWKQEIIVGNRKMILSRIEQ